MDDVHVAIRLRPLISQEIKLAQKAQWQINGNEIYQIDSERRMVGSAYTFDRIFDETCTTCQIYKEFALPTLKAVMNGYNGTIFAYGQTSSGKTHTIIGSKNDKGLIPRMVEDLFEEIENTPQRQYLLRVSYIEIYNEKVYDLLRADRKALIIREDINGDTFIEEVQEEFVHSCMDLMNMMKRGESHRSYGSTRANDHSSRSHTIFKMIIESSLGDNDGESDGGAVMVSHLNLVDLAGSERAGQTGATGKAFLEGCSINTSLFSLRKVIAKLSEGDGGYVSFRDSKLTRILQCSLGGNTKTSIICTVTSAMIEETHSTLKFASTAKIVKNNPVINEVLSDKAKLKRYANEIEDLQKELEARKQQDKGFLDMETQLKESNRQKQQLEARIAFMDTNIVKSSVVGRRADFRAQSNRRETWGGNMGFKSVQSMSPQVLPLAFCVPFGPVSWDVPNSAPRTAPRQQQRKVNFDLPDAERTPVAQVQPNRLSGGFLPHSKSPACHYCHILKSKLKNAASKNNTLKEKCRRTEKELKWKSDVLKKGKDDAAEAASFRAEEGKIIDELEIQVKAQQAEIDSLKKSSQDAQELYQESNKRLSVAMSETSKLKENFKLLTNQAKEDRLNAENRRANLEAEMKRKQTTAEKRIADLSNDLRDYDLQFKNQSQRFQASKFEFSAQLQEAYNQIATLRGDGLTTNPRTEANAPLENVLQQNRQLIDDLESLQTSIRARDEELTVLREREKSLKLDDVQATQQRAADYANAASEREQLALKLSTALEQLSECREELTSRDAAGNTKSSELQLEVDRLSGQLEASSTAECDLSQKLTTATEELQRCRLDLMSRDAAVEAKSSELHELQLEVDRLQGLLEANNVSECGLLNENLATANEELLQCRQDLVTRDAAVEAKSSELHELQLEVDRLQGQLEVNNVSECDLDKKLATAFEELQQCRQDLVSRDAAVEAKSSELHELQLEVDRLHVQLNAFNSTECGLLNEKLATANEELLQCRQDLVSRDAAIEAKSSELHELQLEVDRLQGQLEANNVAECGLHDKKLTTAFEELQQCRQELVSRDAAVKAKTSELQELQLQVDGFRQQLATLSVVECAITNQQLSTAVEELQACRQNLALRDADVGIKCAELHTLQAEVVELRRQIECHDVDDHNRLNLESAAEELQACRRELEMRDATLQAKCVEMSALQAEVVRLTGEAEQRKLDVSGGCDRETELQIVMMEVEARELSLQRQVEELRTQVQSRDKEMCEALQSCELLATKCRDLEISYDSCVQELKSADEALGKSKEGETFFKKLHSAVSDELRRANILEQLEERAREDMEARLESLSTTVQIKQDALEKLEAENKKLLEDAKSAEEAAQVKLKECTVQVQNAQLASYKASQEQKQLKENAFYQDRELIFLQDRIKKLKAEIRGIRMEQNSTILTSKGSSCAKCESSETASGNSDSDSQVMQLENVDLKRKVTKYYKIIMSLQSKMKSKEQILASLQAHLMPTDHEEKENTPERSPPASVVQQPKTPRKGAPDAGVVSRTPKATPQRAHPVAVVHGTPKMTTPRKVAPPPPARTATATPARSAVVPMLPQRSASNVGSRSATGASGGGPAHYAPKSSAKDSQRSKFARPEFPILKPGGQPTSAQLKYNDKYNKDLSENCKQS